ncbi:MAG: HAD family phosphatase [Proteobacteria bacterium]|nr:HAD family phosphatase [Pseudomonadota bacterium]
MTTPAVVFDVGGVLLEWRPGEILARSFPDPQRREAVRSALLAHEDWQAYDRGELEQAVLRERACARSGLAPPELDAFLEALWESLAVKAPTVALLHALRARGVRLYCLSNMPAPVYARLRALHRFWDAFDGVVVSGEVGLAKPDPRIYALLLDRYRLAAGEVMFFDDMPLNVEAARRLGIDARLFRDAAECERSIASRLGGPP